MAAIKQTFFQECEEQLAELESGLLALQSGAGDRETVNAVFRAVHSIKGGAGSFGMDVLVRLSHAFETALDGMRNDRLEATEPVLRVMLRASDVLADVVRAARDGDLSEPSGFAHLCADLEALVGGKAAAPKPAAIEAPAEESDDGFDFMPVQISLSDLVGSEPEPEPQQSGNLFVIRFKPKPHMYANANEAAIILRELKNLGSAEISCEIGDLPLLPELDPEGAYLTWTIRLRTERAEADVRHIFDFVEWDCDLNIKLETSSDPSADAAVASLLAQVLNKKETAPAAAAERPVLATLPSPATEGAKAQVVKPDAAAKTEPTAKTDVPPPANAVQATIRVDLDRVDRLINLIGELVINQSMLSQRVAEVGLPRSSAVAMGLEDLEQLSREIQDSVMAIRAQPVKPVFQRMSRVVREVADATGKLVRLVTEGEGTEVDKTVIERLSDPLTHMIRNAVDHGLEKPEDRIAAGKPEYGHVKLMAVHRSGRIVIEVSDDGAGINRARVKEIAVNKGLIEANAELTDEQIDDLIFMPGFSTATTVSDVSGRGVGMDVVRRSIQALGGRISISSRPGQGSTFTMSLPLTLAVLEGMVVTVAGETLIVPLTAIVETLQPKDTNIHGLGADARVIGIRNQFMPLIDLGRALGYRDTMREAMSTVAILVESENRTRSVLLVDAIVGQRQVVIKSLEANYQQVAGIAAATIMGDGRVAVILDVDTIVAGASGDGGHRRR